VLKNVRLSIWIPLALMAAGCASVPPSSYYTLLPAQSLVATETSAAPVPSIGYAISVQRVIVPEQVNRPQIVLAKDNGAGVQLLNQSIWAAPLGDEWRNALSAALTARLGVLDIDLTRAPEGLPIWVVNVQVNRFDSLYNQMAVQEATWRLAQRNAPKATPVRVCRALVQTPVDDSIPGLVRGHQASLKSIAALIAAQIAGQALPTEPGVDFKGCV